MATAKENPYAECPPKIPRSQVSNQVDEKTVKEFGTQFRVIPMFEKLLYEYNMRKHYSLKTNEHLKCAWSIYKDNVATRDHTPFQFPSDRDLHFHNGTVRFRPSESIHLRTYHRMRFPPGPGIDSLGQLPTPQEFYNIRSSTKKMGHDKKEKQKDEPTEEKKDE